MNGRPDPSPRGPSQPRFRPREERLHIGKALRARVPREAHAQWTAHSQLRYPIAVLEASNQDRLPELVPVRYGRMLRSPFAFLRGSAPLMAFDLATLPRIGVQVCNGDWKGAGLSP